MSCRQVLIISYFCFQAAVVTSEEVGDDFEHVEAQKKKFDDYQKVRMTFGEIQICELRYLFLTINIHF